MGHARTSNPATLQGATPSPAAVLRSRAAQFATLIGRILSAGNTIEASQVHKLRVLARRLRVALKVLTPPGQESLARKLHKQSGKLRSEAGGIRDCDVHLELLHALSAAPRTRRPAGIADAQLLVTSDREHLVTSLQQRLQAFKQRQFLKLAEQLASHIEDHHQANPDDAASTAALRARLVFEQLRTIAASSPSTPEAFHRLRLAVKAFRYAREALATAGSGKTPHAAALADIQTRLGDLNDVATLADRLDRYACHIDAQHASELLPATRHLRDSLRSLSHGFSAVFQSRAAQFGDWWQTMYGHGDSIAQLAPDIPLQAPTSQREFSMISPDLSEEASSEPPSKSGHHDDVPTLPRRTTIASPRSQAAHADLWLAGKVVAVIDIGSNSIRLLIVELIDQLSWKVLHQDRSMTRLAHGLVDNNRLSDEAVTRSIDAIARFAQAARDRRCSVLAAFATAAVRDATNGREFMTQVTERCGVDVRLVASDEEGKLTFESVARVFDLSSEPVAVADLGGGSLEVLHSRRGVITANASMPLGAVRVTERYTPAEPGATTDSRRLRRGVRRVLEENLSVPRKAPRLLIGCGGTFTTIATLAAAARGTPIDRPDVSLASVPPISRREIKELSHQLAAMTDEERARVPGLPADRTDIIVAGVTTVELLMKHLGCEHLCVHSGGIREGLVLKIIGELLAPEAPRTSPSLLLQEARELAVRCGYERRHSEHVATLAGQLYDALLSSHMLRDLGSTPMERAILEAAAVLHDVGMLVSYKGHHRHSCNIVLNNGLSHIAPDIVRHLALICRYHRRRGPSTRHALFAGLPAAEQNLVTRLAAILRVADGLDRSHAQLVRSLRINPGKRTLRIECETDGVEIAPEQEAAMDKADVLARLIGLSVDIIATGDGPDRDGRHA